MPRNAFGVRGRFGRLLAAAAVSQLGSGLHLAALPILATSLTSDPRLIAAVALASTVPGIVLALPVGAWVDRWHRGRLMAGSDLACAGILAGFVLLMVTGALRLWMLFAAAALLGTAELVFDTSSFALVPSLVSAADLERANGHLSVVAQMGGGVLGPAIGGGTYAAAPFLPFAINGLSYLGSSALIGSFAWRRHPRPPDAGIRPRAAPAPSRWRELVAGVVFVRRDRTARTTLVLAATSGLFGWMPEGTLVLFAREDLHASAGGIGLLLAITTIGAVLGGLVAGRVSRRWGPAAVLAVTYGLYGALLIPVAFAGSVWLVAVIFFVQGVPLIVCATTISSVQQRAVPDELLGRFAAVRRVVDGAVVPVGLAAGGFLGDWWGLRPVWCIAGIGFLIVLSLNGIALRALALERAHAAACPSASTAVEPE